MDNVDISGAPPILILLITGGAALAYLGKILSEAYETWAKLLGPLGRRWREKGHQRTQKRAQMSEDHLADVDSLSRQLKYVRTRNEELEIDNQDLNDFLYEDHQYHQRLRLMSVDNGWNLPTWLPFMQWRSQKREDLDSAGTV